MAAGLADPSQPTLSGKPSPSMASLKDRHGELVTSWATSTVLCFEYPRTIDDQMAPEETFAWSSL